MSEAQPGNPITVTTKDGRVFRTQYGYKINLTLEAPRTPYKRKNIYKFSKTPSLSANGRRILLVHD